LLYANDIRNEKVKADLVILSSYESELGRKVGGEGLIALNHAFIYAGARNVISSLWKINDRYSSEFMINFHQEVASGQSYTEALRQAKLQFLADPATAQPQFWAPFVLIGE
jgi:CHAT domain-containing protein